ncbi:MAG TPA: hypothetical protein VFE47_16180 [Tepidisphaeraceae bacterium]|jgi:hypothetical protein|nr:hypothetical protein [Tepidisphaeraceae bacterium]
MNAYLNISLTLLVVVLPAGGTAFWFMKKIARLNRSLGRGTASLWKRAASVEPHLRPPVVGAVIRPIAIHVARRHHAPLPKEPGKLWR